jgi:hypothetical protein
VANHAATSSLFCALREEGNDNDEKQPAPERSTRVHGQWPLRL